MSLYMKMSENINETTRHLKYIDVCLHCIQIYRCILCILYYVYIYYIYLYIYLCMPVQCKYGKKNLSKSHFLKPVIFRFLQKPSTVHQQKV